MLAAATGGGGKGVSVKKPLAEMVFQRRTKRAYANISSSDDDDRGLFGSMQATPKKQRWSDEHTAMDVSGQLCAFKPTC
jgi:hypothetical protein